MFTYKHAQVDLTLPQDQLRVLFLFSLSLTNHLHWCVPAGSFLCFFVNPRNSDSDLDIIYPIQCRQLILSPDTEYMLCGKDCGA